jgi:hypothetical protein
VQRQALAQVVVECPPQAGAGHREEDEMHLTDDERAKQAVEWDAEIAQAKKDMARYKAAGETEKAAREESRIESMRKLRAELFATGPRTPR